MTGARSAPYRVAFTLAESFDAGVAAYGGKWPRAANPFVYALWPDSAWAWDLGWRYAAFTDAAEKRGQR